jgi:phosphoglycerate dehydrogenase-like enzyme
MEVLVATRTPRPDAGVEHVALDELLERSDVVVVACPLTPETYHLLDAAGLARMKPHALLVNVARGPIVDQTALAIALREGRLGGAGLDVFDPEPVDPADPLLGLPNVVAAPHALGYWDQLFTGCVADACRAIVAVSRGDVPEEVANPEVLASPRFREKLRRFERSRT